MRWSNVAVIARREIRDQLRDRRTLFMIVALPIMLYPLLGIGVAKFSEAFQQEARTVVVVGSEALPERPPLLAESLDRFDESLFDSPEESGRLRVELARAGSDWADESKRREALREREADAILIIPADVKTQIEATQRAEIPISYNSTSERSQVTYLRVREVLARWKDRIVDRRLVDDRKSADYVAPIDVKAEDVASRAEIGSGVWARLFPFLLVMMSLTGAFYPAVDLCAGEKERGTMETLLLSPASRGEVVLGKFFTVLLASVTTALLNLLSMGLTGLQLARQVGAAGAHGGAGAAASVIAPPSLASAFWMILLLIPLSVFFSAICLALAVLAKSMKEGQYYMTPLYLVCLPLTVLTLLPGIELDLFYSLVPITGVSLLLRSLIQKDYATAWRYFLPVLLPTIAYGVLALRWAVDQFNREDVLFRDAERFDLRDWIGHLIRDRRPTPGPGLALLCFVVMPVFAWFVLQFLAINASAPVVMGVGQVVFILGPPLLLAWLFTSDRVRTLRLVTPRRRDVLLAVGLALALNPAARWFSELVSEAFPLSDARRSLVEQMMQQVPGLGMLLILFALIPAVCEEFAFRGFILSGLQRGYSDRGAIILSAVMFGAMHAILSLFQQFFPATLLGLLLGLIAVRTRSIWPGIAFHLVHNGLGIALGTLAGMQGAHGALRWLFSDPATASFRPAWVAIGLAASVPMIWMFATGQRRDPGVEAPPVPAELSYEEA